MVDRLIYSCLQILKTRLTVGNYSGIADVIVKTYKIGGTLAFFKGFYPSTLNMFFFAGIDLMTYEQIKHWQSKKPDLIFQQDWSINLFSALCSSAVGVILCYPISTIITRLQVDDGQYLL